jgi:hypothetical protein
MIKTSSLLALAITALASMPAHAQQVRGFVSAFGADSNPCTATQPCRTFQQAFNTIPPNGVIWVLDPAGYGSLTITHGISIQARGIGAVTQNCHSCAAVTINAAASDTVTLDGLFLDGVGSGSAGIQINSGGSVQILNSIVRGFFHGIYNLSTSGTKLLIEDTVTSDNNTGIDLPTPSISATLNRITANNNQLGVNIGGGGSTAVTVANSVITNNAGTGLSCAGGAVAWLAKTVVSGSPTGVQVSSATIKSYGDNYLNDNGTPVLGSLTPVGMQ